ncbi:MAG: hypothetical protein JST01_22875 [Cyanobacteria bacterium SZAS TMP-1]|nr:hypothetical protein [Cyanobacteria bacterium SZAS TMP-1]
MQTTTIRITRQEFETLMFALRFYQDSGTAPKKALMIKWYRDNEEFDLLDGEALEDMIQKINTSNASPRCIMCGWDATCAFGSTENRYCDECKDLRPGAPAKTEPRKRR